MPLTEAMNPVKVYEYLSAGKPVVAKSLPELKLLSDVIYLYDTQDEFEKVLEQALKEDTLELQEKRRLVAKQNTWEMRFEIMKSRIDALYEKASVIIVTWNNLEYTKQCIESVLADQTWSNYEVIVVDNASNDGTIEYLTSLSKQDKRVMAIFNQNNLGFAAANNIGLQRAQDSEFIVLLNNDTIVPAGWLARLLRYARMPEIGIVGPVTNFAGNEAMIEVPYIDIKDIDRFAHEVARKSSGKIFDIPMLAMYCVAMRKEVFDEIGPLDERFSIGMFEDDDYSERVRLAGYRVVCAEDVFVHHYGKISFNKLSQAEYQRLFKQNKRLFEDKWNKKWEPHLYRTW
jgi:GT2 family glycosyltransferase